MAFMFRPLRADEVECRIGQVSKSGKGLSLLLYKTARSDATLLDETVGPENWQCSYSSIDGVLYCTVDVWVEGRGWVSKQDCGTPSNMEADKGNASDAFKRAATKWGIGRELYTAPFIWVNAGDCNIIQDSGGRYKCYDTFTVSHIEVTDDKITALSIRNQKTGKIVYQWGNVLSNREPASVKNMALFGDLVEKLAEQNGKTVEEAEQAVYNSKTLGEYGIENRYQLTNGQCIAAIELLKRWTEK